MEQKLDLPDDETARKVGAIKTLSLGLFIAVIAGLIIAVIIWLFQRNFDIITIGIIAVVIILICSLSYSFARAGKVRFAGYFFVITLLLEFAAVTVMAGGALGPLAILYVIPIIMGGVVLGMNYGFLIATLATVAYFLMIPVEQTGVLPQIIAPAEKVTLVPLFVAMRIIVFYVCAFLSWFASSKLNQALQNTRLYAEELQMANEKLQASEEELRVSNEELEVANEELRATEEELRASNEELEAANEELREAQEQMVRSEKLAAIGQLAGGVGHELRNPLGAIKNAVYYIRSKLENNELARKEPRVMEFLEIVDEEINSSNKIINDLLSFSRVGKPAVSPSGIERVIDDAISHTQIPENVELAKNVDPGLPQVEVDAAQIRQVFINIINNAVQAMPDGGKLTIEAGKNDGFLGVNIVDTGIGIPGEAIGKIFDPLYTMKAKGIGLGLAVCKSIIDRHEGRIEVESSVGKGTAFAVKLPLKTG